MSSSLSDVSGTVADLMGQIDALSKQVSMFSGTQLAPTEPQPEPTQKRNVPEPPKKAQLGYRTPDEVMREIICRWLGTQANQERPTTGCFDLGQFFASIPLRINLIDSDSIDVIVRRSWQETAIDLRQPPTTYYEAARLAGLPLLPLIIDIYIVQDNLRDSSSPLYIIFQRMTHPVELVDLRHVFYSVSSD
jgi:hypothetical protein